MSAFQDVHLGSQIRRWMRGALSGSAGFQRGTQVEDFSGGCLFDLRLCDPPAYPLGSGHLKASRRAGALKVGKTFPRAE